MPSFKDNLESFPSADGIQRLEFLDADGRSAGAAENKPGSQGSLRLYLELVRRFGTITPQAAEAGCVLYAEHTQDARLNPGKHPNIDRLLAVIADGRPLAVRIVRA
jgi:hypothetical protein